jgi:hypothetical protein
MRYLYILPVTRNSLFAVVLFWCRIKVILKAVYKTVNDYETVPCYTVTECKYRDNEYCFQLAYILATRDSSKEETHFYYRRLTKG